VHKHGALITTVVRTGMELADARVATQSGVGSRLDKGLPIEALRVAPQVSALPIRVRRFSTQVDRRHDMSMLLALAVSIGLLAIVATWLFLGPLAAMHCQIWQAFVAWASFFHNGGKTDGAVKTAVCMTFGAIVGMLSVMLAGQLGGLGALAAPVAVGIGAAAIVLAAHIPQLSTIPSCVYGFATVAGLILLGKDMTPTAAIVPTIISIVIGTAFGWVSEMVAGKLTKSS
jgi:hypothetical protein